jgi:NAD(P)-dependent dehydrogenase (short-subunit alcohol dehydrogenase family)
MLGVYGPNVPSTEVEPSEFDNVMAVNYRGLWLCSREETKQMQTQEPLPTHDGRPASRGTIVNLASSLAIIPAPGKSKLFATLINW